MLLLVGSFVRLEAIHTFGDESRLGESCDGLAETGAGRESLTARVYAEFGLAPMTDGFHCSGIATLLGNEAISHEKLLELYCTTH